MPGKFVDESNKVHVIATIPYDLAKDLEVVYNKLKEDGVFNEDLNSFYGWFIELKYRDFDIKKQE